MSSATIPNSDIVFRRDRTGDRALVFVHGFLDDQYVWNLVIADLAAQWVLRAGAAAFGRRRRIDHRRDGRFRGAVPRERINS